MIYLGTYAPRGWLVTDFTAIVPLSNQVACHILLPVRILPPPSPLQTPNILPPLTLTLKLTPSL
jgi:hypothetical protein